MSDPRVTAICLTADRQKFTDRAVKSFIMQAYQEKHLLIFDTGKLAYRRPSLPPEAARRITCVHTYGPTGKTIGELRNLAVGLASTADIIVHWDSDDWSGPQRIREQVEILYSGGFEVTGYSAMVFWDYIRSEAWLYDHRVNNKDRYCLGTSLAYKFEVWRERGFKDTSSGEDSAFCDGRRIYSNSAIRADPAEYMMLASIHEGNAGGNYSMANRTDRTQREWTRLGAIDHDIRRIMEL